MANPCCLIKLKKKPNASLYIPFQVQKSLLTKNRDAFNMQ